MEISDKIYTTSAFAQTKIERVQTFDILSIPNIKINQNCMIDFKIETKEKINIKTEQECKILKITSKCNLKKISNIFKELTEEKYPNLFIFIVETQIKNFNTESNANEENDSNLIEDIKLSLTNFSKTRPLVLQLTSEVENVTKIFYKDKNLESFVDIAADYENFEFIKNFPTFMFVLMNKSSEDFESVILDNLTKIEELTLILRFLRILRLRKRFLETIILKIAETGTKDQLLAVLDISFENDGHIPPIECQQYLRDLICDCSEKKQIQSQDTSSSTSSNDYYYSSVLFESIYNDNNEIFDYLISYCTPFIQQLPQEHQILVSSTAFENSKYDILCDLLEYADYPFPGDFKEETFNCERLDIIVNERKKFHEAINNDNLEEIKVFTDNNPNLKTVYCLNNKSTLLLASESKSVKSYFYLRSQNFDSTNCPDIYEVLTIEETKLANAIRDDIFFENINQSLPDAQKSVNLLCTRSFINNQKLQKNNETEQRGIIKKWYQDLYQIKFGPELLQIVASCENLKIIFDFESLLAKNNNVSEKSEDYSLKLIFIGAKLSNKKREQQIKGILAYKLCQYVLRIVYENFGKPYYKKKIKLVKELDSAIQSIYQWSCSDNEDAYKECNKIVSSVFKYYNPEDFHAELIVRVIHMLAEFDDNEEKTKYIQEKYKLLFDFWETFVFPELKNFNLKNREDVRKMNRTFELIEKIEEEKLEFSVSKNIKFLLENQFTIVTTNITMLLFINIYNYFQKQSNVFDTQNLFVDSEKLKNTEIFNDLKTLISKKHKLNVVIDCSQKVSTRLKSIIKNSSHNFVFVVSDENKRSKLEEIFSEIKNHLDYAEITYKWEELTTKTKNLLLVTRVKFQNNPLIQFSDLLDHKKSPDTPTDQKSVLNISSIIDDVLLNLWIRNAEIRINSNVKQEIDSKFQCLFKKRILIRNTKGTTEEVFEQQMIGSSNNAKFILLSDKAGNGKSWMMKNFANMLRQQNIYKWTTYVDLKQFINEFKAKEMNCEFSSFFAEKILKPENKFELNVFKKLYDNGKVFILFDGFDEIAPDCTESVISLFQSFEYNGGNQLWIATRDYFEGQLQQELNIDIAYKLDEFGAEDGINFIVANWVLTDRKDITKITSRDELDEIIKNSPNLESYLKRAREIVSNVMMDRNNSIGLPLMFKMIAKGLKNYHNTSVDINSVTIFEQFVDHSYERWAYEKGLIKKRASIESQKYEMNFIKFHQYSAIESFAPELIDVLFQDYDKSEWPITEIVSCGLITKSGEIICFVHETLREYFVSILIKKSLEKKEIDEKVLNVFVKILSMKGYEAVRRFLNHSLKDYSVLEKLIPKMVKFIEHFYKMENFKQTLMDKLNILTLFIIEVLKYGDDIEIKNFIKRKDEDGTNILFIFASYCEDINIYKSLWQLLLKCFKNQSELKDFILQSDDMKRSFANYLVRNNTNYDVVELTFKVFIENFTDLQLQEILLTLEPNPCKNLLGLLHSTSLSSNNFQVCHFFQNLFNNVGKPNIDYETVCKTVVAYESKQHPVLQIDSLSQNYVKVNENISLNKTKPFEATTQTKHDFKILTFTSNCTQKKILSTIQTMTEEKYPNLFIFIVKTQIKNFNTESNANEENDSNLIEDIKLSLTNFSKTRPLVLQLTSEVENVTKIFYKDKNLESFVDIAADYENFESIKNFPTFMFVLMNKSSEDFESVILDNLTKIEELTLILRFLRILRLRKRFLETIILKIAETGTKDQLLAVLDISFENDGHIPPIECQQYLRDLICDCSEKKQIQSQDTSSSTSSNDYYYSSVLFESIYNDNNEIFDYLISYCTPFIQQLPQEHQILVSSTAFENSRYDILCDLLEYADYPFPGDFKEETFNCERLDIIVNERKKFHEAIINDNLEEIKVFTDNNPNLKTVYCLNNKSSLLLASESKSVKSYFYLRSLGFESFDCADIYDYHTNVVSKEKDLFLSDLQKSVNWLITRSFINNRKIKKTIETNYRNYIRKWYEDIYKIKFGSEILEVAASCENLKIIFEFEKETIENLTFADVKPMGSTDSNLKMIFIGAKMSDKKREQQIKGVLAHEICHYVMKLVYENKENPFYKKMLKIKEKFEEIIETINQWSSSENQDPDDECNSIISSVFKNYNPEDFHAELIVRVIHMLAEFDDNEKKTKYLQEKYKLLFDFWETFVFPELKNFNLKNREDVRKMNRTFELIEKIEEEKLEFSVSKNIKFLLENQFTIVTTNITMLLFINIYNYFQEQSNLFDTQNLFIDSEKLKNTEIFNDLKTLISKKHKLNVVIDCSQQAPTRLKSIIKNSSHNFVFVVSDEKKRRDVEKILSNNNSKLVLKDISYSWKDLTTKTQIFLLKTEIDFQKNSILFYDLLRNIIDENQQDNVLNIVSKIIDEQLLCLLLDNNMVKINFKVEQEIDEYFDLLFYNRMLIEKKKEMGDKRLFQDSDEVIKIKSEELMHKVKKNHRVLISDISGNGKSWMMKNFANMLRQQNIYKWTTYVDLKQFINEFRAKEMNCEFSSFFAEKILKPENKFELNVFKKLYDNGKAFILFDGFDEIAPDCTESVISLFQSFEYNGGNQLWIATRDYFEGQLQQELSIDVAYKLDEFGAEDGINFIVANWVLTDRKDITKITSRDELDEIIKNSPNLESYLKRAREIVSNVMMDRNNSIGLPLMFKMIAKGLKNYYNTSVDINSVTIFEQFVDHSYERWAYEKGLIKKRASIESQKYEMNFIKFHQYSAIESFAPELIDVLFQDYDKSEWPITEIVSCGLMTKSGEIICFVHETLREYFVAIFIMKSLNKRDVHEKVLEIFGKLILKKGYHLIRRFLNDSINDNFKFDKILPKMDISNFICIDDDSFHFIFSESLEKIITFMIDIFKKSDYWKVKHVLYDSSFRIVSYVKSSKIFFMFQDFLLEFLDLDHLKDLILKKEIFSVIFEPPLEIEIVENFITKINELAGHNYIQSVLSSYEHKNLNVFHYFTRCSTLNAHRIRKFLNILEQFLTISQIFDLAMECGHYGGNILENISVFQSKENFKLIWKAMENLFKKNNLTQNFAILVNADILGKIGTERDDAEFHKIVWELFIDYFENPEDLKDYILRKEKGRSNYLHHLVEKNKSVEVIKVTLKIFKKYFTEDQFNDILNSKHWSGMNLLQTAARYSKVIQIHEFLWEYFQDFCQSIDDFLIMLMQVDYYGKNILYYAAGDSTQEIFNFMLEELEKSFSKEIIKELLSNECGEKKNLLQYAAEDNKHLENHQNLWKIFHKYFDKSEILNFIKHVDKDGNNLLFNVVKKNYLEVIELTWGEIKNVLDLSEQIAYVGAKGWRGYGLKKVCAHWVDKKSVKEWVKNIYIEYGITNLAILS